MRLYGIITLQKVRLYGMITLEIMYQNTILLSATWIMPQPSNYLNFLSFQPWKYLKSCLVFFHGKQKFHFIQSQTFAILYRRSVFTVPFIKNNFPLIFRTENMWLWRKWDLCANIHTSANIAVLQCNLKYHFEYYLQFAWPTICWRKA